MSKLHRVKAKAILMMLLAAIAKRKQELVQQEGRFMLIFRKFLVRKNERGLLFKEGDFIRFLDSGTYHQFDPLMKMRLEVYDLAVPEFQHRFLDLFLKQYAQDVVRYFTVYELTSQQVALVYKNGRLADILPPSSRTVYWQGLVDVKVEVIDITEQFELPRDLAAAVVHGKTGIEALRVRDSIYSKEVPQYQLGVLYVDGKCLHTLSPGLHAYWQFNRRINVELWDTRLQEVEVSGQEILSKDKVSLRLNLSASYVIKDVLQAVSTLAQPVAYLYKELQFGLRAAVGTRTLDELLENKNTIDELVFAYIRDKMTNLGIEVKSVGVKDIILPGEMKTILSRVVEAEKAAQANLIRRREETAATRSLLNTAKVMEDNPTALRLKELETLEKVTEKIGSISVYGGLEGLLKELVRIK
jgi:regulator of protease activity HflC (stomatin/prohibitin superfamily)